MSNAERNFSLKERMRMRKLRATKKSAQHDAVGDSSNSMPYQSSQSLGKAVKRARMSQQVLLNSLPAMAKCRQSGRESRHNGNGG